MLLLLLLLQPGTMPQQRHLGAASQVGIHPSSWILLQLLQLLQQLALALLPLLLLLLLLLQLRCSSLLQPQQERTEDVPLSIATRCVCCCCSLLLLLLPTRRSTGNPLSPKPPAAAAATTAAAAAAITIGR